MATDDSLRISLILVDPKETLYRAWMSAFREFPEVSVVQGRFEALREFDCLVSAANSFGLMDGALISLSRDFSASI